MSYEKARYISINKKSGKIFVTSTPNNIYPYIYEKWELGKDNMTFVEKLNELAGAMFEGNIQPNNSCKYAQVVHAMRKFERMIDFDTLRMDFRYDTTTYHALEEHVIKHIAIPYFENGALDYISSELCKEHAKELNKVFAEQYEKAQAEMDASGKISIQAAIAIWSNGKATGYDALASYDGRVIVAHAKNYNNRGLLDNTDGTAIVVSNNADDWHFIGYRPLAEVVDKYPQLAFLADAEHEKAA